VCAQLKRDSLCRLKINHTPGSDPCVYTWLTGSDGSEQEFHTEIKVRVLLLFEQLFHLVNLIFKKIYWNVMGNGYEKHGNLKTNLKKYK
jgi:hypothetical protein